MGTSFPFAVFQLTSSMPIIEFSSFLSLAQTTSGGGLGQFLPIILLFVGMWFLIIAPQRKRQKAHEKMLRELQTGDEIITTGGLYGTITNVKDDRFVIRIADNTKVELAQGFVASKAQAKDA
jgi:preprotein translocase subunit YajC